MRTVILQDGTNAILKEKDQNEDQLFSKYIDLIEAVDAKYNPDKLILMQVPPIRQSTHHEAINKRIKCFNDKLTSYTNNSEKSNLDVLPIHNTMINLPNYNSLLYDDIHFSFHYGVPFLKNSLLSFLLKTSNNVTTFPLKSFSGAKQNYLNNRWEQSYHYMQGNYGMNYY